MLSRDTHGSGNPKCIPNVGGLSDFDCTCPDGYRNYGGTCFDINECAEEINICQQNSTCCNIPGGFECPCNNGYIGDGKTSCVRNPCETGDHNCHINAVCIVSNGSFECKCKGDFIGDGVDHCTSTTTMSIMKETNDLLDLFRALWRLLQTLVLFSTDFINVLHK